MRSFVFFLMVVAGTGFVAQSLDGCAEPSIQRQVVQQPVADPKPYTIGSDDLLDILVWKQPDVSGTVRVAGDGTVTVPLLGNVQATGRTTDQLADALTSDLLEANPQSQSDSSSVQSPKPSCLCFGRDKQTRNAFPQLGRATFTSYCVSRRFYAIRQCPESPSC